MRYSLQSFEKSQFLPLCFAMSSSSALKLAHVRNEAGSILLLSFSLPTGLLKSSLICCINDSLKKSVEIVSQRAGKILGGYVEAYMTSWCLSPPFFFGNTSSSRVTAPLVSGDIMMALFGRSAFPCAALQTVALERPCFFAKEFGFCFVFSKYFLNCIEVLFHK